MCHAVCFKSRSAFQVMQCVSSHAVRFKSRSAFQVTQCVSSHAVRSKSRSAFQVAVPIFRNGMDRNGPELHPKTRNGPRDATHAQDISPLPRRKFCYIAKFSSGSWHSILIQLVGCILMASQQNL